MYNPKDFHNFAIVFRGGPLDGQGVNVQYFPYRYKTEGTLLSADKLRYKTAFYEPCIIPDCSTSELYPIEKAENDTLIRVYRFEGFLEGKHVWMKQEDGTKQCFKCGITKEDAKADLIHNAECRGEIDV